MQSPVPEARAQPDGALPPCSQQRKGAMAAIAPERPRRHGRRDSKGMPFYATGTLLVHRGRWRLVATAGRNWGCFDLTL
jgi:hypothetical protein